MAESRNIKYNNPAVIAHHYISVVEELKGLCVWWALSIIVV